MLVPKILTLFVPEILSHPAKAGRNRTLLVAQFEEGKKGELKVGEYGDFIVLSADLTKIPPSQYTKVRVLRTVVGGRTVYQGN